MFPQGVYRPIPLICGKNGTKCNSFGTSSNITQQVLKPYSQRVYGGI